MDSLADALGERGEEDGFGALHRWMNSRPFTEIATKSVRHVSKKLADRRSFNSGYI